jgi:hypothetical protein
VCDDELWDIDHGAEAAQLRDAQKPDDDANQQVGCVPDPLPLEYGEGFGMNVRIKTRSGEAAVLRVLWPKENAGWRITSYDIEQP